jgi:hypothetical protein
VTVAQAFFFIRKMITWGSGGQLTFFLLQNPKLHGKCPARRTLTIVVYGMLAARNGGAASAVPEASHSGVKAINPRGLGTASPSNATLSSAMSFR